MLASSVREHPVDSPVVDFTLLMVATVATTRFVIIVLFRMLLFVHALVVLFVLLIINVLVVLAFMLMVLLVVDMASFCADTFSGKGPPDFGTHPDDGTLGTQPVPPAISAASLQRVHRLP